MQEIRKKINLNLMQRFYNVIIIIKPLSSWLIKVLKWCLLNRRIGTAVLIRGRCLFEH